MASGGRRTTARDEPSETATADGAAAVQHGTHDGRHGAQRDAMNATTYIQSIYRVTVGTRTYIATARNAQEAQRYAEARYGEPAVVVEIK